MKLLKNTKTCSIAEQRHQTILPHARQLKADNRNPVLPFFFLPNWNQFFQRIPTTLILVTGLEKL